MRPPQVSADKELVVFGVCGRGPRTRPQLTWTAHAKVASRGESRDRLENLPRRPCRAEACSTVQPGKVFLT